MAAKEEMMAIAAEIGSGVVLNSHYKKFWEYVTDDANSVSDRLEVLRPLVFTEWDEGAFGAQDAYERLLCELPEYDARIDEYYAEFEVGPDGLCECERRYNEGLRG